MVLMLSEFKIDLNLDSLMTEFCDSSELNNFQTLPVYN